MSVLLFVVGAIAVLAGAVMVGFGIPINEFSFGNTLIGAGATTFMGGLVILGLGAVVAQLQRVVEALGTRPLRASRPMEPFEQPAARRAAALSRIPFPPKPKTEVREQRPSDLQLDLQDEAALGETLAPTLHNPDEAPVAVEESDELPLSPAAKPMFGEFNAPPRSPFAVNGSGAAEKRHEPFDAGRRAPPAPVPPARQPQTAYFDAMWPAKTPASTESRSEPPKSEPKYEPKQEVKAETKYEPKSAPKYEFVSEFKPDMQPEPAMPAPAPARVEPEPGQPKQASEPRAVAILKSGVVDGMGYTLYVDGSIEAELPQGTLRFASINELRSHLEKTS